MTEFPVRVRPASCQIVPDSRGPPKVHEEEFAVKKAWIEQQGDRPVSSDLP
jgi:hypothetical protein